MTKNKEVRSHINIKIYAIAATLITILMVVIDFLIANKYIITKELFLFTLGIEIIVATVLYTIFALTYYSLTHKK